MQQNTNSHPWQPENDLDAEIAARHLAREFPGLSLTRIELFGHGWDNAAFLVNDDIIFRFPRREIAVHTIETEIALLPLLQGKLPLVVPNIEWVGQFDSWPFVGYRKIDADTGCALRFTLSEREALITPLARFLQRLHSEELLAHVQHCGVPIDLIRRVDPTHRVPLTQKICRELQQSNVLQEADSIIDYMNQFIDVPFAEPTCLTHGDLYLRHILFGANKTMSAVIDWGDAHLGNPAVDLSIVYSFLPLHLHQLFWQQYGDVTEEVKQLAKMRAIYSSVMLIDYGSKTASADLVRVGREGLDLIFVDGFSRTRE